MKPVTLLSSFEHFGTPWSATARVAMHSDDPDPAVHLEEFRCYFAGRVIGVDGFAVFPVIAESLRLVAMAEFLDLRAAEVVNS